MARIKVKQARRCRVQLSISTPLWDQYQNNLDTAKQIGAEIDFGEEFEVWFKKQNEQVTRELGELQSGFPEKAQRKIGLPAASVAAKTVSGGGDHGNN